MLGTPERTAILSDEMPRKPLLLREPPRSRALGLGVALGSVALCTAAIYPLKSIAPVVSLGVVYLLAVIVVSIFWGLRLGLFTALLSAVAFNFFHLPPTAQFTISDSRNWVALAAFFVVAAIASTLAELGRSRTEEADARRREADLIAELARTLLAAPDVDAALPVAAERIASALELPSAALRRGVAPDHPGRLSLAVTHSGSRLGTLVVPAGIDPENLARLQERLVPGLEALLATAIERESLLRATVETEALRRSDEIKTALLRTVSHDLRTPITAIRAAAEALTSPTIGEEDRADLREAIIDDSDRLAGLVDNLLDLSGCGRGPPGRPRTGLRSRRSSRPRSSTWTSIRTASSSRSMTVSRSSGLTPHSSSASFSTSSPTPPDIRAARGSRCARARSPGRWWSGSLIAARGSRIAI